MQQLSVNAFLSAGDEMPVFSVNGPPGTGKTTLLKDVIAGIVVERAMKLAKLSAPDDAFEPQSAGDIEYGTYKNHIFRLKDEYKAFGMLVVSNNNGAVENITHELPAALKLKNKSYDISDYKYFSEVSDLIFGKDTTWALNAAALGNKKNRLDFIEKFWPYNTAKGSDEKDIYNFNEYLRAKTKHISQGEWDNAKTGFNAALKEAEDLYKEAEEVYPKVERLRELNCFLSDCEEELSRLYEAIARLSDDKKENDERLLALKEKLEVHKKNLGYMKENFPMAGLWAMLFPRSRRAGEYKALVSEKERTVSDIIKAENAAYDMENEIKRTERRKEEASAELDSAKEEIKTVRKALDNYKAKTGSRFSLDEYFTEAMSEEAAKSSPWDFAKLNEAREKLFLEALRLHKYFVENSKCQRENLDGFSKWMRGMISPVKYKELLPELLQSFFMTVPVVSTTFASVGSFLRFIPKGNIPYVFIDEAGQAAPQSAAGIMWRAKKAIIVGDPLQIEPVVTMHEGITEKLCEYYGQDEIIKSKYTSMQTLADRINPYVGFRNLNDEKMRVGSPLTVHNRCQKRVFDIANAIAYDNKMIFATAPADGAVCTWTDVSGHAENSHFIPEQAREAAKTVLPLFMDFLKDETKNHERFNSVFVISPFKSVKSGLQKYFRANIGEYIASDEFIRAVGENEAWGGGISRTDAEIRKFARKKLSEWIKSCIGTIHTFQGKEAETVIICLGVDERRPGAAVWASERPNILNVAVTRSKKNVYIIGDKKIWGKRPYFKEALKYCR